MSALVTDRSADVATVVVAVALLLPVFGSDVAEVDGGRVGDHRAGGVDAVDVHDEREDGAADAEASAFEQVTVPVPPTAGVVHDQPAGVAASETNVVPAGSVSESVTVDGVARTGVGHGDGVGEVGARR